LQATALLRAFEATSSSGRYHFPNPEGSLGEAALRSPTVFNFFEPNYVLPGPLAAAGLYAPEYQILTDTTAISIPNQLRNFIHTPPKPNENALVLKLAPLVALAQTPDDLIDYLDLVFCAGAPPPSRPRTVITETTHPACHRQAVRSRTRPHRPRSRRHLARGRRPTLTKADHELLLFFRTFPAQIHRQLLRRGGHDRPALRALAVAADRRAGRHLAVDAISTGGRSDYRRSSVFSSPAATTPTMSSCRTI
jgi:hypothetical protein